MIEVTILFKTLQANGYLFSEYIICVFFWREGGGVLFGLFVDFYVCFGEEWLCLFLKEAILHV